MMMQRYLVAAFLMIGAAFFVLAQEKSVKPGINDSFKNPDVEKYAKTFEGESREVYLLREKIAKVCEIKPGEIVADIGAGTGLFTRLFAQATGPQGQVFAVDIAPKFLEHIQKTSRDAKLLNVTPVLCNYDAVDLPPQSVDVAFICDTYHHFEYPEKTMRSLHRALRPGGRVIVVDFHRIPGRSSDWTLNHVRADQATVLKEISSFGFEEVARVLEDELVDNYLLVFRKSGVANINPTTNAADSGDAAKAKAGTPVSPAVPGYGAVVIQPSDHGLPKPGSKLVIDLMGVSKDTTKPPPGLERAATFLNLATAAGLPEKSVQVSIVLHGDAAVFALTDEAYLARVGSPHSAAELMAKLKAAGAELLICQQSLRRQKLDATKLRSEVTPVASAVSTIVNLQMTGYAYVPSH